jgi:predicted O-methyltransferase YrrM
MLRYILISVFLILNLNFSLAQFQTVESDHYLLGIDVKGFEIILPFSKEKTKKYRYYFENPAYSYHDGLILNFMMRHFNPHKYIEIGSGYSSCMVLDTNELFLNNNLDIKLIEPYSELIKILLRAQDLNKISLIEKKLQDVPLDDFKNLDENDILFIDSTHVSKLNSDVNYIFHDILPVLKKGVVIHMHDIFWPFEYPKNWIDEGRAWNELYMLRNFLMFNDTFEVLYFANFIFNMNKSWFEKNMPLVLKNPGGNFWMKKIQ